MKRLTLVAVVLMLAVSTPIPAAAASEDYFCVTPADGYPYGSFGTQDTRDWRLSRCLRDQRDKRDADARLQREEAQRSAERERLAKVKEEQRREEGRRGGRVDDSRAEAARQRAADCAILGVCPSTVQDVRDQLKQK